MERADNLIYGVILTACAESHQMTNNHQQDCQSLQSVDILYSIIHCPSMFNIYPHTDSPPVVTTAKHAAISGNHPKLSAMGYKESGALLDSLSTV